MVEPKFKQQDKDSRDRVFGLSTPSKSEDRRQWAKIQDEGKELPEEKRQEQAAELDKNTDLRGEK